MRSAVAVQRNGFGPAFRSAKYASIARSRASPGLDTPRRGRLSVIPARNRSTRFRHDPLVGVKWTTNRGRLARHRLTAGVL